MSSPVGGHGAVLEDDSLRERETILEEKEALLREREALVQAERVQAEAEYLGREEAIVEKLQEKDALLLVSQQDLEGATRALEAKDKAMERSKARERQQERDLDEMDRLLLEAQQQVLSSEKLAQAASSQSEPGP